MFEVNYCVEKSPPVVTVLGEINYVHSPHSTFVRYISLLSPSTSMSSQWSVSLIQLIGIAVIQVLVANVVPFSHVIKDVDTNRSMC